MKKVANKNQNVCVLAACARLLSAAVNGLPCIAGAAGSSCWLPNERKPIDAGRSGTRRYTSGISPAQHAATVSTTGFQPPHSASAARPGTNMSVPVAVLAVSSPMMRPRLVVNQRLTMVAPRTLATAPEPMPESSPHVRNNCHGAVMK